MNNKQQELYEKLLKKVNEFCLGQAAEDVIEAIDDLVDSYECTGPTPSEALNAIKEQMPKYDEYGTVEISKAEIRTIEKELKDYEKHEKALEIIKKFAVIDNGEIYICPDGIVTIDDKPIITVRDSVEEYELLKEVLK